MTRPEVQHGEGERLHSARRRHFWLLLGGLALLGAVAGFFTGFLHGHDEAGGGAVDPSVATMGAVGVVVMAIAVAYASWRFFVTVDELEVADNLWASLIGFYAYAILFPAWWALWRLGRVSEPDDWAIFGTSMIVACVAYLVRKWQAMRG